MKEKLNILRQDLEVKKNMEELFPEIEGLILGRDTDFLYLAMSYGIIQVPIIDLVELDIEESSRNRTFVKLRTKAICNIKQLHEGYGAFGENFREQEHFEYIGVVSETLNLSNFPFPFPFPSPKPFPAPIPFGSPRPRIYPPMKFDSPTDYEEDTITASGKPPRDDATDDHIKGVKEDDLSIVPTLWGLSTYETGTTTV